MVAVERTFVAVDSATASVNGAGFHPGQGVWHTPAGRRPTIGVIASHYNVDFSEHYLAPLLAAQGIGFLGWNTRYRNNDTWFLLEHALVDVAAGVRWLRADAGVDTVVALGNCGGGSLMATYQSQASAPTISPSPGLRLPPGFDALPATDLYVSLQAHLGRAEVLTDWMDPSVTDESDPLARAGDLDMFDPQHGPPYRADFVDRYRAAQANRNDRITAWATAELDRVRTAGMFDRPFTVARTWADLRFVDPSLDPSARPADRCLAGDPRRANASGIGIAATTSLRSWLSMWSRTESQCQGRPHLAAIDVPALVVQSDADTSVFPSDARTILDALASTDKQLVFVGGDHYLEEPVSARADTAAMIGAWVRAHAG